MVTVLVWINVNLINHLDLASIILCSIGEVMILIRVTMRFTKWIEHDFRKLKYPDGWRRI
jgi:hypothetical protein